MSRLVLFVDGDGDVEAAPVLVSRLWAELPPDLRVGFVDSKPFRIKGWDNLTGRHSEKWTKYLQAACTRPNTGGVLLLLDADTLEDIGGCVRDTARELAISAQMAGAGTHFSVAVVFFRKEFESLLIASYPFLPGHRERVTLPQNVEEAPRGAKGWLKRNLAGGYRETEHQVTLTHAINFEHLRGQSLKCFQRLEHAILELATAFATGAHIISPRSPDPATTDS